jgi:hypothetical protein
MEVEMWSWILVYTGGWPNSPIFYRVYSTPTSTNIYLNARLHHHLVNKQTVRSTYAHSQSYLWPHQSSHRISIFLWYIQSNGCSNQQILRLPTCMRESHHADRWFSFSRLFYLIFASPLIISAGCCPKLICCRKHQAYTASFVNMPFLYLWLL